MNYDGELTRGPPRPAPAARLGTIPLSAIDPRAPARLVRGSAARFRVRRAGSTTSCCRPTPGEGHRWIAYFKNGIYVEGDRSGRVVRRIS